MKRRLKELAILLAVLAVGGAIVVSVGIIPIRASDGHWAVTKWLLDFASDRSVAFHSQGIKPPALDEPGMIALGAATYESNCRGCHGRPGQPVQPVASGMTPKPPYLADAALTHDPEELFYVVKHGIKFAGMPAWPTQRRDKEIWPVIAFLKELPNLDSEQYRTLVAVDEEATVGDGVSDIERLVINHCAVCHGRQGEGAASRRVPALTGQSDEYLRLSLHAYKSAKRFSGVMQPIASRLSDGEIAEASIYFSAQIRAGDAAGTNEASELWKLGEQLANHGDQASKIPSCVDCHGPGPVLRSDAYPQLAGQPAWYLESQLELFNQRARGGSENASLMHPIASKLDQRQRAALAEYYSDPIAR